MNTYYQLFFVEGILGLFLFVEPEGPRFISLKDARECYDTGKYAEKSKGSTEDHSEYKVKEVRNGKLYEPGGVEPLRRTAPSKFGDFVIVYHDKRPDQICVESENGLVPLTLGGAV